MSKTIARTLKGFRDFLPDALAARDHVERVVAGVFERFGFQPVETPTLEYAALKAKGFVARAKEALSVLPRSEAKAVLFDLADFALAREA